MAAPTVVAADAAWTGAGYPGSINAASDFIWASTTSDSQTVYFSAAIVPKQVDIRITSTKLAPDPEPAIAGSGADNISYRFRVTNDGPDDATNLTVDVTPATTVAGISCDAPVVSGGGAVASGVWTIGSLAATDFVTLEQKCTADAASVPGNYSMTLDNVLVDQVETGTGANSASENSSVIRESNLATTKTASSDPLVAQGSELIYTITVLNNGPSDAANAQFVDTLPAGFDYISNDGGCVVALPLVTCNLGTIADGDSATVIIVGTVNAALGEFLSNTATASSDSAAGSAGEESDTIRSEVVAAVPSGGTALISVQKVFLDGNDETEVTLTLQCVSGTYAPASISVVPDNELGDLFDIATNLEHIFVIDSIPEGVPNPCTVVEEPIDGYGALHICAPEWSTGEADGDLCLNDLGDIGNEDDIFDIGTEACGWTDVRTGDSDLCVIVNYPLPVDVEVTKVWDLTAAGRNDVDTDVRLTLFCDAEILGGSFIPNSGGLWRRSENLGDSDYLDEDGDDQGFGVADYQVVPDWYRTRLDPDDQRYTECWVEENASNDDAVLVDNDCVDIELSIGQGASCTITNTVFYEGIPTLNQYGMALLALLMLGMGFIGIRRIV